MKYLFNLFVIIFVSSCFKLSNDSNDGNRDLTRKDDSNSQKERSHHGVIDYRTFFKVGMEREVPPDEHITIRTMGNRVLYSGSVFGLEQKKKILLPFKQEKLQVFFRNSGKTRLVKLDNNQLRIGY